MSGKQYKVILQQLGLIVLVIVIGTIFDWIAHQASPRFGVPREYFSNKVLFGSLIGFVAFRLFRRHLKKPTHQALAVSFIVAVLLQTRYYLEGYDLFFVFLFMGIHFVAFLVPALFIFKRFKRIFSA